MRTLIILGIVSLWFAPNVLEAQQRSLDEIDREIAENQATLAPMMFDLINEPERMEVWRGISSFGNSEGNDDERLAARLILTQVHILIAMMWLDLADEVQNLGSDWMTEIREILPDPFSIVVDRLVADCRRSDYMACGPALVPDDPLSRGR